jgi:hypothetical protein
LLGLRRRRWARSLPRWAEVTAIVVLVPVGVVCGYLGLFTIAFSLLYQDIDGPTSPWARAAGTGIGLMILLACPCAFGLLWTRRKDELDLG